VGARHPRLDGRSANLTARHNCRSGRPRDEPNGSAVSGVYSGVMPTCQRIFGVAVASVALVTFGACSSGTGTREATRATSTTRPRNSTTRPPRPATATRPPRATGASDNDPAARIAHVPGQLNGAPPCTTGAGQYDASISHPERAPLQTYAAFDDGAIRWALCGADPVMSDELLNLRSSNSGKTWTVTDTGFGISPHHAGDELTIRLKTARVGTAHLVIAVAPEDRVYATDDGGQTWRLTCNEPTGSHPSPCPTG